MTTWIVVVIYFSQITNNIEHPTQSNLILNYMLFCIAYHYFPGLPNYSRNSLKVKIMSCVYLD